MQKSEKQLTIRPSYKWRTLFCSSLVTSLDLDCDFLWISLFFFGVIKVIKMRVEEAKLCDTKVFSSPSELRSGRDFWHRRAEAQDEIFVCSRFPHFSGPECIKVPNADMSAILWWARKSIQSSRFFFSLFQYAGRNFFSGAAKCLGRGLIPLLHMGGEGEETHSTY